jgi:hypothetical protein
MQFFNNTQINDWEDSKRTMLIDYSGKTLEYIYPVKSEKQLKKLLNEKNKEKKLFEDIKDKLKFSKIICRFFFNNYKPNLELQKKLIDFQVDVFDELSVQLIATKFNDFKSLYEYAKNKKLSISIVADTGLSLKNLKEFCEYLISKKPTNTRWTKRKIDSYYQHYLVISRSLKKAGIDYHLVSCSKRCGIKESDFNDIAVPIIARGHFGFKGCCFAYREPPKQPKNKKPFFPSEMDKFDIETYKFNKVKNKSYKESRTQDSFKIDSADVSKKAIDNRDSVKRLFQYLKKFEKQ